MNDFSNETQANDQYELIISDDIREFLHTTAKWSKFLSIIGFIVIGFMVVFSLTISFVGGLLSDSLSAGFGGAPPILIGLIYLLFTGLYFYPIYCLYQFASKMKTALYEDDQDYLSDAFNHLKKHYKFLGIMTAIVLGFYAFMFVTMVIFI